jgi:hypothetical protein
MLTHSGYNIERFCTDLPELLSVLEGLQVPNLPLDLAPCGMGFILWITPIEILDLVFPRDGGTRHPAAIWLFAGEFETWISAVREKSPKTVIFVQVGSVRVLLSI